MDKLGPRKTFFCACMLSLGCSLFLLLSSYVFRRTPKDKCMQQTSLEIEQIAASSGHVKEKEKF